MYDAVDCFLMFFLFHASGLVKSTVFQEAFMKEKDHPTLKSLWKDLDAAMKWAKIKSAKLADLSLIHI